MTLKEQIESELKEAMKAKDAVRLRTLRSLRAALLEKEISERKGGAAVLSEEQVLQVLQKQAKQRRDSIEQYEQGGRDDLAGSEKEELTIIETYLPKQLDDNQIRSVVLEVVTQVGAESIADMGKVMGPIMGRLRGKADGKRVNQIVREVLSS